MLFSQGFSEGAQSGPVPERSQRGRFRRDLRNRRAMSRGARQMALAERVRMSWVQWRLHHCVVMMDDAYIGGSRSGRRGQGAPGKTPFVAAIATTDDGRPISSSFGPSKPSAVLRSKARKHRAQARRQHRLRRSGMLRRCHPSGMPAHPNKDRKRQASCSHPLLSNGSIRRWAISKPPSWGPTEPREKNTSLDISRSSNIDLIADTISKTMIPPPRIRCVEDRPDALPLAKTG